jgi:hypothetical protein
MNGNNSYTERNSGRNIGEELFEQYCINKQVFFRRLGFDEKKDPIPNFYSISPLVRNLPDYIVANHKGTRLVSVKGTANIKATEVRMIPQFLEWYHSRECPLWYAFCFSGQNTPIFRTPDQVIQLYQQATDKQWNDGVTFRTLRLDL